MANSVSRYKLSKSGPRKMLILLHLQSNKLTFLLYYPQNSFFGPKILLSDKIHWYRSILCNILCQGCLWLIWLQVETRKYTHKIKSSGHYFLHRPDLLNCFVLPIHCLVVIYSSFEVQGRHDAKIVSYFSLFYKSWIFELFFWEAHNCFYKSKLTLNMLIIYR